jgi:hypothetical protein
MPRAWISFPLFGGIRAGYGVSDSDFRVRLPSWRRFELRSGLQAAAKARGEHMDREEANYIIDRALADGTLDGDGEIAFNVRGTREEISQQILETAKIWGISMNREAAEEKADAAIAAVGKRGKWARIAFKTGPPCARGK